MIVTEKGLKLRERNSKPERRPAVYLSPRLPANLLLEVTGMTRDKIEKKWTVENRWLPAVNAVREQQGWPRWDFLEIAEDIRDARNDILKKLGG